MENQHDDPGSPDTGDAENRDRLARRIGAQVRAARLRSKQTSQDIAEQVGLAVEIYERLERGKLLPSLVTLLNVARALGLSTDALLGVNPTGVSATEEAGEPQAPVREPRPELRRLVRNARLLGPGRLRLLALLAESLARRPRA